MSREVGEQSIAVSSAEEISDQEAFKILMHLIVYSIDDTHQHVESYERVMEGDKSVLGFSFKEYKNNFGYPCFNISITSQNKSLESIYSLLDQKLKDIKTILINRAEEKGSCTEDCSFKLGDFSPKRDSEISGEIENKIGGGEFKKIGNFYRKYQKQISQILEEERLAYSIVKLWHQVDQKAAEQFAKEYRPAGERTFHESVIIGRALKPRYFYDEDSRGYGVSLVSAHNTNDPAVVDEALRLSPLFSFSKAKRHYDYDILRLGRDSKVGDAGQIMQAISILVKDVPELVKHLETNGMKGDWLKELFPAQFRNFNGTQEQTMRGALAIEGSGFAASAVAVETSPQSSVKIFPMRGVGEARQGSSYQNTSSPEYMAQNITKRPEDIVRGGSPVVPTPTTPPPTFPYPNQTQESPRAAAIPSTSVAASALSNVALNAGYEIIQGAEGNKYKILGSAYESESSKISQSKAEDIMLSILIVSAKAAGINYHDAISAMEIAKSAGGFADETNPNIRRFSSNVQKLCKACGIISGRDGSEVGLRLAHVPQAVIDKCTEAEMDDNFNDHKDKVERKISQVADSLANDISSSRA